MSETGRIRTGRVGRLVFTGAATALRRSAEEGASAIEGACRTVYGALLASLAEVSLGAPDVIALQHYTASQSWLSIRQRVRAEFFGTPAAVASYGVPVPWNDGCWLRASAIAFDGHGESRRIVPGASFGMPAIAAAAACSEAAVVSGLLRRQEGHADDVVVASVVDELEHVLATLEVAADRLLVLEAFVSGKSTERALARELLRRGITAPVLCAVQLAPESGVALELAALAGRSTACRPDSGTGPWSCAGDGVISAALLDLELPLDGRCGGASLVSGLVQLRTHWQACDRAIARITTYLQAGMPAESAERTLEAAIPAPLVVIPTARATTRVLVIGGRR